MKGRLFSFFLHFLALSSLASCAGYHFNTNNNPLIGYDIRSVSVPMFINRSIFPDLAAPMTKEITLLLNDYPGLRVTSGNDSNVDAVLIGIIESRDHYNEVVETSQTLFTDDTLKTSVGSRSPFYYPVETKYDLSLRFILIKKPSQAELQILASDLGKSITINPKVVLRDQFDLSSTFSRVVGDTASVNGPGTVNFVKNKGIFEKSLQETSVRAAQTFKQVILNAF